MVMEGVGVGYLGLGAYLPDNVRTNDWWPDDWKERQKARLPQDIIASVEQAMLVRSPDMDPEVAYRGAPYAGAVFRGAEERRVIPDDMPIAEMEARACRAALEDAGLGPEEVDMMMGFSQLRDFALMGNQGAVARRLGLARGAPAFEVGGGGCVAFQHQLRVATRLVQAGDEEHVLTFTSSAVTRITDFTLPSSVGVGDGAVAGVIGAVGPGYGFIAQRGLTRGDLYLGIQGAPAQAPDTPWYRTDQYDGRFLVQKIDRDAAHVMGARAATICRETCEPLFEETGYSPGDVDFVITSQPTAWFGQAICDALGIEVEKSVPPEEHFQKYAHLMASSMPLNMYLARKLGKLERGDLVLIYSPEAGAAMGATLYRWNLPREA